MSDSQLDVLIGLGKRQVELLEVLAKVPATVPVQVPGPVLLVDQKRWSAIGLAPWHTIERPAEGTLGSNLTFPDGRMQFNKRPDQPGGYGSSVVGRFDLDVSVRQLAIRQEVMFPTSWAGPRGCKHLFWSGGMADDTTNHFIGTTDLYDGRLRPTVGLQSPFMTYYADFVVQRGVPYVLEMRADFTERWLEIWVDGVRRKVNATAWTAPSVDRVENVRFFADNRPALRLRKIQYDPTEPAGERSHVYGPLEVRGIPA